MLKSQNGGRDKDSDLLAVADGFESCTYSHLSLTEADIAAHQTVHRSTRLHVVFDIDGGFELVRSVLVHEAGFQLVLQVAVGAESESASGFAFGVESNEVFGDVLDLLLGFLFEHLPSVAAQAVEGRRLAIFAHIAANLVKAMNADVESVVVFVDKPDDLLLAADSFDFLQS